MVAPIDFIVSCEHASNAIPEALQGLGLPPEALAEHHSWDAGASEIATYLAEYLEAPLFLGQWSRLVADLNRPEDIPQVVPEVAFGLAVPGNTKIDAAERRSRLERYHRPYWGAVMGEIQRRLDATERRVLHVSMHSFTPEYEGVVRSVSIGVMFDPDYPLENELGDRIVHRIRERGLVSEVNEPYDGRAAALTTSCRNRFDATRYAGIEIEMNQKHLGELELIQTVILDALRYAVADAE